MILAVFRVAAGRYGLASVSTKRFWSDRLNSKDFKVIIRRAVSFCYSGFSDLVCEIYVGNRNDNWHHAYRQEKISVMIRCHMTTDDMIEVNVNGMRYRVISMGLSPEERKYIKTDVLAVEEIKE